MKRKSEKSKTIKISTFFKPDMYAAMKKLIEGEFKRRHSGKRLLFEDKEMYKSRTSEGDTLIIDLNGGRSFQFNEMDMFISTSSFSRAMAEWIRGVVGREIKNLTEVKYG